MQPACHPSFFLASPLPLLVLVAIIQLVPLAVLVMLARFYKRSLAHMARYMLEQVVHSSNWQATPVLLTDKKQHRKRKRNPKQH